MSSFLVLVSNICVYFSRFFSFCIFFINLLQFIKILGYRKLSIKEVDVTKSGYGHPWNFKIATLNQVWMLNQVLLNQVELTLQKPVKIWD